MNKKALAGVMLLASCVAAFAAPPQINPAFRFNAENPNFTGRNKNWMMDPKSNCWLFDGNPAPNETVEWSGACQDQLATGEGTATFYEDGKYRLNLKGSFTRGSLTGHGTSTGVTGNVFDGEFAYSARYGFGVMTKPNGEEYRGNWPGNGTYSLPNGTNCPGIVRRYQRFFVISASCAPEELRK